ncbi:ComF family protein [Streptomyces genisteinicus]|uniref:ComF family protein n=1 Tax=Streptomyces genisteinicus TaxID=2768068 RepID=A0A7H0HSR5_9ACTN|nr:ComF family protein [Streptomyces genisteinicus]QNP63581.1 ComF family protein [Streptomyces genisteinicus]
MREWWREISGLVLPVDCAGCGRRRTLLCARCARALHGGPVLRARPVPEPEGLPAVHAAAAYGDAVRAVILAHKERGSLGLAEPLGRALAGAVRAAAPGSGAVPLLLVPVPSAPHAVRARGHDAGRRIAVAAAAALRRTGRPAQVLPVLRQVRPVADQAGLGAPERLANMSGSLRVRAGADRLLSDGVPVLVDDVMTTGASLTEAARALSAARRRARSAFAGFVQVSAAVVAVPPPSPAINRN